MTRVKLMVRPRSTIIKGRNPSYRRDIERLSSVLVTEEILKSLSSVLVTEGRISRVGVWDPTEDILFDTTNRINPRRVSKRIRYRQTHVTEEPEGFDLPNS